MEWCCPCPNGSAMPCHVSVGSRRPEAYGILGCLAACSVALPLLSAAIRFEVVPADASGIRWVHVNARSDERHLPETVGAGVAFLDFDNDGWLDIYFVNSGPADFYRPDSPLGNALYRNNGDGTFADVTRAAGVAGDQFGMGVAAADFDRDGDTDLYVTSYGRNLLFRNRGDGTFDEVARETGVDARGWYTDAVWFDYDRDAHLDLFVSGFVSYSVEESKYCGDNEAGRRHYCIPRSFRPTQCLLYRNNGDGTFSDASEESGIASVGSKSFGAVATDINRDGALDLFVANDTIQNFLFVNRGDGTFSEEGLFMGVAYSDAGTPRSGMGVDAVDYDGDGWEDLFVANIDHEMFSLYRNLGGEDFVDASQEIRQTTRLSSGWGLRFSDFDNDGDPDLLLANGHPDDMIGMFKPLVSYKQKLLLLEHRGGAYADISDQAGEAFKSLFPARGLAVGDFDNDGDPDAVISNNGAAPLLLRNVTENDHQWIGLRLEAKLSNAEAVGAVVTWRAGGMTRGRLRTSGGSYLSSHDPRELLGLAANSSAEWIEVRWPSGTVDRLEDVSAGGYRTLREGAGFVVPDSVRQSISNGARK